MPLFVNEFLHCMTIIFWFFSATVANLQQKLEQVQADNCLMKEDLAIAKNTIITLQSEANSLADEKDHVTSDYQKQIEVCFREDILNDIFRGSLKTSLP